MSGRNASRKAPSGATRPCAATGPVWHPASDGRAHIGALVTIAGTTQVIASCGAALDTTGGTITRCPRCNTIAGRQA